MIIVRVAVVSTLLLIATLKAARFVLLTPATSEVAKSSLLGAIVSTAAESAHHSALDLNYICCFQ